VTVVTETGPEPVGARADGAPPTPAPLAPRARLWPAFAAVYRAQLSRARVARIPLLFVATFQSIGIMVMMRGVVGAGDGEAARAVVAGSSVLVVAFVALNLLAQYFGQLRASGGLDTYATLPVPPASVVLGAAAAYASFTVPGTLVTAVTGCVLFHLTLAHLWVLAVVIPLPFYVLLVSRFGAKMQDREQLVTQAFEDVTREAYDISSNVAVVKKFSQEEQESARQRGLLSKARVQQFGAERLWAFVENTQNCISTLGRVTVICAGGYMVLTGRCSVGDYVLFIALQDMVYGPISQLSVILPKLRRNLSAKLAYHMIRWRNVLFGMYFFQLCRRKPDRAKELILGGVKMALGPDYDIGTHFTPRYNPWEQRLCLVPDGDLFRAIREQARLGRHQPNRYLYEGRYQAEGRQRTRSRHHRDRDGAEPAGARRPRSQRRRQQSRFRADAELQGHDVFRRAEHGFGVRLHQRVVDAEMRSDLRICLPADQLHGPARLQTVRAA